MLIYLKLIYESMLMAWNAIIVNKLRTFLSLLGVTIGIFAIISVFTAVDSLEDNVKGSLDQLGSNTVFIEKWPWAFGNDYPWWKYWQRPLPAYKEMDALKQSSHLAEGFCYMAAVSSQTIKYKSNNVENCDINMVSHDYAKINSFNLEEGRYFSEAESYGGYPVAVIGHGIKEGLFPAQNAVGQEIIAKGRKFKVIGVFTREGESVIGNSNDKGIMIPVNYARKIIDLRSDRIQPSIMVKAKKGVSNQELMYELKSNLRAIRRLRPMEEDNFALNETKLLSTQVSGLFNALSTAGWVIGGFSILVGGFGIANIMFVSVKERTPLIGIQKSLGAKSYFILIQFLTESVVLCLIGGLLGLLLVFIATLLARLADQHFFLSMSNILLGLIVSSLIGIISGFIPAYNASRLDPVEAIRANG